MQRIRIHHLTEYHFSSSVTLNQHRMLIRPRVGHDVRIEWSRLDIFPSYRIKWQRDMFDNSLALVTFDAPSTRLTITSEVMIQHYEHAPFDFMLDDSAVTYPFSYAFDEQSGLISYQQPIYMADQPDVHQWLRQFGVTGKNTFGLLMEMNRTISGQFQYRMREEAGVQSPSFTLRYGSGSCRDYATLLMEACRALGLASRFVSGYLLAPATEVGNATTHAWVEVYLPGAGWKGFDPTTGHVVGNQHIAVAVARNPESVPPVSGSFIGTNQTTSRLTVNVQVNLVKSVL
jgi:transglutaminase-like putative cysteine protease